MGYYNKITAKKPAVIKLLLPFLAILTYWVYFFTERTLANKNSIPKGYLYDDVLVLGSGGYLGVAWQAATLLRMERNGEFNSNDLRLIVGTSAGSIVGYALASGVTPEQMVSICLDQPVEYNGKNINSPSIPVDSDISGPSSDSSFAFRKLKTGHMPRVPTLLTSLLPLGKLDLESLELFINSINGGNWPERPLWITATNKNTGERKVFRELPDGHLSGAIVSASCSIPALYKPVTISESEYIDGGAYSALNLDLALRVAKKRIVILAPISGFNKITFGRNLFLTFSHIATNVQEVSLWKTILLAKLRGIEVVVIRPRESERLLMESGRLMNNHLIPDLVTLTLLLDE